jgi:erythromycin esterase-like protein
MKETRGMVELIADAAHPILGAGSDYDPLLELVADARIVLLGEATHGTHEFYRERARITRRLIEEKGFTTVAVEADWPDAYRINRFIRSQGQDQTAQAALGDFTRFPLWMWRNTDVLELVEWLRTYNRDRSPQRPEIGFYGLDLYSMYSSIDAVLRYLDRVDPEAADRARHRYRCFDHFDEDSQAYGYAASIGATESCQAEAVRQLRDLQRRQSELAARDGRIPADEFFFAEQNARLVRNAEEYYRTMFHGPVSSWNLRDRHMAETLEAIVDHVDGRGEHPARVVVWEHNSHIGDARATEMGERGEWNVGQLVRERFGAEARLIGFTTATGTVAAADDWGDPPIRKQVRSPLPGSFEEILHQAPIPDFLLPLRTGSAVAEALRPPRLERAIGVIYRPESERLSHYFHASLADQFDAVVHFDETRAVEPLDRIGGWASRDAPETYPFET